MGTLMTFFDHISGVYRYLSWRYVEKLVAALIVDQKRLKDYYIVMPELLWCVLMSENVDKVCGNC